MNLQKITATIKKDPKTEFIYSTYQGTPDPRYSRKAEVITTKRYSWSQFPGYSDQELNPNDIARIQAEQEYQGTTDYYLLIKVFANSPSQKDYYTMTKPKNIKGFYGDVSTQWAKEKQLHAIIDTLANKRNQVIAEQTGLLRTRETLVKRELETMLKDVGITEQEVEQLQLRADINIEFGTRQYPELEHLSNRFTYDLDNFTTQVSYRVINFAYDHLQLLMEVIQQLRQNNIELARELEREKRQNATR